MWEWVGVCRLCECCGTVSNLVFGAIACNERCVVCKIDRLAMLQDMLHGIVRSFASVNRQSVPSEPTKSFGRSIAFSAKTSRRE